MSDSDLKRLKALSIHYDQATVYREIMGDLWTPVGLLFHFALEEQLFLLESAKVDKTFSRFSYFGFQPKKIHRGKENIDELKGMLQGKKAHINRKFGDFNGGYVGYIGYEAVNHMGGVRRQIAEGDEPLYLLFEIDQFFLFDNYRGKLYAATVVDLKGDIDANYAVAVQKAEAMERELLHPRPMLFPSDHAPIIEKRFNEAEFVAQIKKIKQDIIDGEMIQMVLSNRYTLKGQINPVSFYRVLRRINPSPYLFFIKDGDQVLCGSSPETHLKVENRRAILKPIAGTYRLNPGDNVAAVKEALLKDPKERAEHLMLLDLARNDLYTSCKPESVKVTEYFVPEQYSHLIHIVSSVEGVVQDGVQPFELFQRTFPAGTVSGAPKVRAMELVNQYEALPRGFYAGCVGYFNYNGDLDTAITIRSAMIKKDEMILQAGAGIVYDSEPKKEYQEVEVKLNALFESLKTLDQVEGGYVPVNR